MCATGRSGKTGIPRAGSVGEETFAQHCRAYGIEFEREVEFAPGRKFLFDFVLAGKLAVEIQGGTRHQGRHSRHEGMEKDFEKLNLAVTLGYRVLLYTTQMVLSGFAIDQVRGLLGK